MPPKRNASRGQAPATTTAAANASSSSPALNALLVMAAVAYGLLVLVERRAVSWPPRELLSGLYTLAGCLAMIGPLLLWRRGAHGENGLGDLTWMVGGLIVWIFDLEALARGDLRGVAWATPLEPELLGPIMLAVMLAGWRIGQSPWNWTWTNVTGGMLGLIWVGMGVVAMLPDRSWLPDLP